MERVNEHDLSYRNGESGPKYFFKGPHYEWGKLALQPGETFPEHYHNEVEETFYLVEGENVSMVSNGATYTLRAGDVLKFTKTETHGITNNGTKTAYFIFIKAPFIPGDKVAVDAK